MSQLYNLPDGWSMLPKQVPGISYAYVYLWVYARDGEVIGARGRPYSEKLGYLRPPEEIDATYPRRYDEHYGSGAFAKLLAPAISNSWLGKYEFE